MGKTRRRNPYARELEKPQYRGRKIKDKRKRKLEALMDEDVGDVICYYCGFLQAACICDEVKNETPKQD